MTDAPVQPPINRVPRPTAFHAIWWPASVRIPGEPMPWSTCKILAGPDGLYVWRRAPEVDGHGPDWFSPIDFSKTPPPPPEYALRSAGVRVETALGTVAIALDSGCGCGHPLKHWSPEGANKYVPWPKQEG